MSNHGFGYGLHPPYGGGGAVFNPERLNNLVHYWNAENVTTTGDPAQITDFAQLATGDDASETTESSAFNRGFLLTEDWSPDSITAGAETIPVPNGYPYFGTASAIDSVRNETDMQQVVDVPYTASVGISAIFSFFVHGDVFFADNRRMMTGSGKQYFEFDGHGNVKVYDSGRSILFRNGYTSKAWCDEWHILTWTWDAGSMQVALDGAELADEDPTDTALSSALAYLTGIPSSATNNTFLTHYMIWKQAHSMEDLDTVARPLATLLDLTYAYTPLS